MTTAEHGAGAGRLAGEFLTTAHAALGWWLGELAAMLPSRLRGTVEGALVVEPTSAGLRVGRETASGWQDHAQPSPGGRVGGADRVKATALLRLPAELALCRRITLAQAAEENLHEVVGFQLDRYVPFELDEVLLGCAVVERDPDSETIDVAMAVVPRADVEALRAAATLRGLNCERVMVAASGRTPALELDTGDSAAALPAARWPRLAWAAAVLLAVANIAVPLVQGHSRLAALQQELAGARQEAQAAAAARDEVEQATEQEAVPIQRWQRAPLSALLTEVTHVVPDNSWVTQMQIDQASIQLTGFSDSANGLIPVLERSQLLTNAAFRSPVTQDLVHKVEQFHLSVDLRSRVAE